MKQGQATLLVVEAMKLALPLAAELKAAGFQVQRLSEDEAFTAGQAAGMAAALLAPGLKSPLSVARQLHRHAPLAHLVFLSDPVNDPAGAARLKQALTLAPLIGNYWTLARLDQDDVLQMVQEAVRAAAQRRQLRTTLDRINMRLAEAPPADPENYRKLVISDRFLASILNSAQDAIISLARAGTILTWNEGAKRLFLSDEADALGLAITLFAAEGQADALQACVEAARQGERSRRELVLTRKDGSSFDADVTAAPVHDETGNLMAVSVIIRDISVRRQAQRELERLNAELEQRVEERTARLEEANKELESFAYSLSHDLRSPLSSISGFSQALLEDWSEEMGGMSRFYLERIQANTARMEELINAMMFLSRIARQPLNRAKLDLCALAWGVLADLQPGVAQQVSFRCTVSHNAEGDASLLSFALENLFNNAFKYRHKDRLLELELGSVRIAGKESYFVKDNGIGFDMGYAERIFEPFQRLHTSSDYPGTGVGLATVQRIIQRHGGRIWAEAAPDKGATFFFTLGP